ncbi:nitrate/nitrite transporter [Halorubellus sp. JP-L1]|uniref:MFS transporter n=1 Tax=Halorubellus sp. JP-L1 TaxID=2715753 RepID=UPI0037445B2B
MSDSYRVRGVDVRTIALVAGMFVLSAAAGAYEIAPASVIPLVRDGLQIGPTAAGWLVSVMYLTAVVLSVPVGVALDRFDVRNAVTAAALALLVAGVWGWVAATEGSYWSLFASRALGGFAYVVFWNAGADVVGQAVDADVRATAVSAFTASAPVGFAFGQFGSPLVADAFGWPAIFPFFATVAVLGMATFLAATAGESFRDVVETPPASRAQFRSVFANRAVWTLATLSFLAFSLYLFLNTWLPSYLENQLDVSLALAGALTALFPAVGVVARTGGGVLSDRFFGGARRPVVVLSFLGTTPALVGFVAIAEVPAVVAFTVVSGFTIQLSLGLLFTYVTEVVPEEVTTTAISTMTSVGLFGAFLAPIVAGELIERSGYQAAFLAGLVVALAGVVLAWRAPDVEV